MNISVKTDPRAPESSEVVGSEMRALRRARQMTLANLAEASQISVSHLSAIERGGVNPSLEKINRIAAALSVPAGWFFAAKPGRGPLEQTHIVRQENRRNLNLVYGVPAEVSGYRDWLLSSSIGGGFYMGLSEFPPLPAPQPDVLYERDGEQHLVVLDGELVLRLGEEIITLRAGDSYSIPGEVPHHISNETDRQARAIWVNSPVIIPAEASPGRGAQPGGNLRRVMSPKTGK